MTSEFKSPQEIAYTLGYQRAQLDILRQLVPSGDRYLSAKDIELICNVLSLNPFIDPTSEPIYPVSFTPTPPLPPSHPEYPL